MVRALLARIGELYVRVGGSDDQWRPTASGFTDFREYAVGAGWKVWVKVAGNPAVVSAPHHSAFPVAQYKPASKIKAPF